ncbi:hypothetical protein EMCRGX_G025341 [Ephydatia muelleri]
MAEKSAQEKLLYQDVLKYLTERSYRAEAEKQWKRTIRRKVKYFTVNDDQKRVMEACHNDKLGKLASKVKLKNMLEEVRTEVFTEVTSNIQTKQMLYYDHKHARTGLQLGDHVLFKKLRNLARKGGKMDKE